ncbi:MAG: Putative glycosyltransferase [Anaerolinea thermophila]|uniref:Putative glycosyltransferase n=1 Tax=Anaerolinea thermophila TaxID=167964 RepID=A0A101FXF5_9CHLR|nr:MAG: Putative glycosyltransferase [Anaerolinea thermophila]
MPRIGMNPSRGVSLDFEPARTTVAVLVYAPYKAGYFQNRMDVTKMTIQSILANTEEPFDLLVFDNGSSPEMVEYLQELYKNGSIDYLHLSKSNIGKLNALNMIFNIAPGEIVAYCDDDVFHLPGWLGKHLEIIDTFPNVGAVTGFYIRERVALSSESTLAFANKPDVETERGLLMPRKWEQEYLDNSGRTWERYQEEVAGIEDIIVNYRGLKAWVSAHHFQMVTPKKVMQEILSEMLPSGWTDRVMGQMIEMDDMMDAKGYLRFCTYEQTMRLMGNAISEEVSRLAQESSLMVKAAVSKEKSKNLMHRLANVRWIRHILQGIVNRLYDWLNK